MKFKIYSAVQTEVVSLSEAKLAIKVDSTDFDDNITVTSCVTGGYHSVTATATGSGISVLGNNVLVALEPVSLSASATLDVKLQESLDDSTYTDVSGGTFTQVTTANDSAIQELEYNGEYPYIRAAYTIVNAEASFSVNVIKGEPTSVDDSYIENLIEAAREHIEHITNHAIGSQKWKIVMDDFPDGDKITLPFPPLTDVDSVTYLDSDGVSATMSASESNGYIVDTDSEPGGIFLAYGSSWPSFTAYPHNAVQIITSNGYTSSNVPKKIKDSILKLIGLLYEHRIDGLPPDELTAIKIFLQGNRKLNL